MGQPDRFTSKFGQLGPSLIERDQEGFLKRSSDWSLEAASAIAADFNLSLGEEHITVILHLRNYYAQYGLSPPSRVLMKLLRSEIDPQFSSIQLMQLFGGRARRNLAQIAGLPKPSDCD